jgi:hypothetical protein
MSWLQAPWQVPDLQDILPEKNGETMLMPEEEDQVDLERPWLKITKCPFKDAEDNQICSSQSWKGADVWSMESAEKVLAYLMQHGTHSTCHNMSVKECYAELTTKFDTIMWESHVESFSDRDAYRKGCQRAKDQAYQEPKPKSKRRKQGEPEAKSLKEEVKAAVVEAIGESADAAYRSPPPIAWAGSSTDAWSIVGQPPPALANNPYVHQISAQGDVTVDVPIEKLKLIQDSLQRSEHAISSAFAHGVENARKLAAERAICISTINLVSAFTNKAPEHFKGS